MDQVACGEGGGGVVEVKGVKGRIFDKSERNGSGRLVVQRVAREGEGGDIFIRGQASQQLRHPLAREGIEPQYQVLRRRRAKKVRSFVRHKCRWM